MTDYSLPLGWVGCTLGDMVTQKTKKASPGDDGCPTVYLGMDDIESESGRILTTQLSSSVKSAGNLAAPGDILYGRLRPYLNKVAVAPENMLCSGELLVFRPEAVVDVSYVLWLLRSPALVRYAMDNSRGDRPRAYWDELENFPVPLAPREEQIRIVEEIERRFSRLAAAERSLQEALRKLSAAEDALAEAAITGSLLASIEPDGKAHVEAAGLVAAVADMRPRAKWRMVEPAGIGTCPTEWGTVALGRIVTDADYGTSEKSMNDPAGVPVIRIPNIRRRTLDVTDLKYLPANRVTDDERLAVGDVLFIRSNGSKALIGVAAAVTERAAGSTFASYLIRFRLGDAVMAQWVELVALAPSRRRWLVEQASSSAGQNNLGQPDIAAMPIPIPARTDMVRILAEYERRQSLLDAARATITRQLARCSAARSSILTAAFTGQLVPQDPSDEHASVLLERIREQRAAGDPPKTTTRRTRAKKETTP